MTQVKLMSCLWTHIILYADGRHRWLGVYQVPNPNLVQGFEACHTWTRTRGFEVRIEFNPKLTRWSERFLQVVRIQSFWLHTYKTDEWIKYSKIIHSSFYDYMIMGNSAYPQWQNQVLTQSRPGPVSFSIEVNRTWSWYFTYFRPTDDGSMRLINLIITNSLKILSKYLSIAM